MKLQTQFTVPNKDLLDLDYVNEVEVLEETLIDNNNLISEKVIHNLFKLYSNFFQTFSD